MISSNCSLLSPLLTQFSLQMPEEDTFAVLVKIMQDYRMREMFKPSMAELGLCMYQLDTLVQEHIPDLYVHFQSQVRSWCQR